MAALLGGLLGAGAISAAGNVGGALISSDAQAQALADARSQIGTLSNQAINGDFLGQFGASDIFGSTPAAALYQPVAPVDFGQVQLDTIAQNLAALPSAETLSSDTNAFNLGQSLNRINALVPDYQTNLDRMGSVTQALLLGKLPYSDVLDVTNNRSSLAGSLGTPGGSQNATLKDLGLSQLSAETTGANMFETMLQGAQQVMPQSQLQNPASMFYDPTTMANLNLQQNAQNIEQAQLEQQSAQSANNLAAAPNPAAASLFNLNASLIPATLNTSGAALGGGIAAGANALGSGLSTATLLSALRGNSLSGGGYGSVVSPGLTYPGISTGGTAYSTAGMSPAEFSAAF